MKTIDYLDQLKELKDWSDYRLEKELNLSDGAIAHWRKGRSVMSDTTCAMIQDLLGLKDDRIIYQANKERSKKEAERIYWQRKLQALAATIIITNLILTPTPSEAAPIQAVAFHLSVLCQMAMLLAFRYRGAFARRTHATLRQQTGF